MKGCALLQALQPSGKKSAKMFKSLLAIFVNIRTIAISVSSYNAAAFQQEKYLLEGNTNVSPGKKEPKFSTGF